MSTSAGGVANLVFKRVIRGDLGRLSLDGLMLSVLMCFDGKKTLLQIAEQMNMELVAIKPTVARLVKLGPLSSIVVEDALDDLGAKNGFPVTRAAELVNYLAQEIQHEDKRIAFKQAMLKKLKEIE